MLPEEQAENSRYFYELASARFGWSWDVLKKVQAFHFKLGQGAKTGTGGHLPGPKVVGPHRRGARPARGHARGLAADVPRLARRRRLPPLRRRGARALGRHPDRRQALGAAHRGRHRRRARDRRRLHHPRRPRRRHRRGAAAVPRQHLGADDPGAGPGPPPSRPARPARRHARRSPAACATPPTSRRRSRSGADAVAIANSAIQAIGCLGMRACHTDNCPVGIATQKPHLRARLPVDEAVAAARPLPAGDGRAHAGARARVRARPPVAASALDDLTTFDRDMADAHRHRVRRRPVTRRRADELVWHKVAELDELADGRVKTVDAGPHDARAHALRRRATARSTTTARTRAARSARARSRRAGCAARGTATTTTRSPARRRPASPTRPRASRSRCAPTASTSALPPERAARAHRLRRDGRDDGRVGRHARVRHGRPLQPRLRRRDARAGGGAATSRSSASATRARPRSRRRPTASSPAGSPRASRSPGPGSTNLLTGLYDAKVDRAPVLAISGQVPSKVRGRGAFQDLDLTAAFADVAVYSQTVLPRLRSRRADEPRAASTRSSSAASRTSCCPTRCRCCPAGDAPRVGAPSGRVADDRDRAARRRASSDAVALLARRAAAGDRRRPRRARRHGRRRRARRAARRADAHDVQGQGPRPRRPPARRRRARPQRHAGRVLAHERVRPAASCSARRSRTTPASRRTSRSCRSTPTRWRSAASTR